jgi:hypothetical protein
VVGAGLELGLLVGGVAGTPSGAATRQGWLGTLIESILRSSPDNRRRCASDRFAGAGRRYGLRARPPHRRHSAARPAGRSLGGNCDLLVTT